MNISGKFVGLLHGIPVLLKDHINTNDMPGTSGSLSLAGYTLPSPMRSAGAIILATKHPALRQTHTATARRPISS